MFILIFTMFIYYCFKEKLKNDKTIYYNFY